MRINQVVDVEAPPERVWPYLEEPDKIMGWFATMQLFRWTSEPGGVGSTFRWVEETAGRNVRVIAETTEWRPPNVFGFRMTEGDFDVYEARWTVEPTDTGCRVAAEAQIKLSFGSGMLFSPCSLTTYGSGRASRSRTSDASPNRTRADRHIY